MIPTATEASIPLSEQHEQTGAKTGGLFSRLLPSPEDQRDAQLWRLYMSTHENLVDGKRYQRRFMGREFARIYLRAMKRFLPSD